MSNKNNSGKFFKFKIVQLVRKPNPVRQTRQNTEIRMQGTAEEQFAQITAAARAEALTDIDDLLSDDESVDYLPAINSHWNHKCRYRTKVNKSQTLMKPVLVHQK